MATDVFPNGQYAEIRLAFEVNDPLANNITVLSDGTIYFIERKNGTSDENALCVLRKEKKQYIIDRQKFQAYKRIVAVAVSSEGNHVVIGDQDGKIILLTKEKGSFNYSYSVLLENTHVNCMVILPNNILVIGNFNGGGITFYHLISKKKKQTVNYSCPNTNIVAFMGSDQNSFISIDINGKIYFWNAHDISNTYYYKIENFPFCYNVGIYPDKTYLIALGKKLNDKSPNIFLLNKNGQIIKELFKYEYPLYLATSPDGIFLVVVECMNLHLYSWRQENISASRHNRCSVM